MTASDPFHELVKAVGTLCLASADEGAAPDEWSLATSLAPFVEAIVRAPQTGAPILPTFPPHDCDAHARFDRTQCAEPCGMMHHYCGLCGRVRGECAFEGVG